MKEYQGVWQLLLIANRKKDDNNLPASPIPTPVAPIPAATGIPTAAAAIAPASGAIKNSWG